METERYVLFSPVGMTDPISGNRDGSMLHIARKYKPEMSISISRRRRRPSKRQTAAMRARSRCSRTSSAFMSR